MMDDPKWVQRARAKMGKEWRSAPQAEPGSIVEVIQSRHLAVIHNWFPHPLTWYDVWEEVVRDENGDVWRCRAYYFQGTPPDGRPHSRDHFKLLSV